MNDEALSSESGDAYFRNLLESAPDAMVIVDASGAIAIINRQTEDMFGYARAELVGQNVETLLPERLRGKHVEHRETFSREILERST